jgi:hypothetical protein
MLTFKQFILLEARKNPQKNKKITAYEYLKPYSKNDDIYITFTELKKVGINPKSDFNTPNGVYTYPLKETWEEYNVEQNKSLKHYPFASNRPYITILKAKHSKYFIRDMKNDYSSADYDRDKEKLLKMCNNDNTLINDIEYEAKTSADNFHKNIIGYFWNMTRLISKYYRKEFNLSSYSATQAWNDLLRRLGYTGFADKSGFSIIHSSEPIQAVFLTSKEYTVIDQILNKDYVNRNLQNKDYLQELIPLIKIIKPPTKKTNVDYIKNTITFFGGQVSLNDKYIYDFDIYFNDTTIINSKLLSQADHYNYYLTDCFVKNSSIVLTSQINGIISLDSCEIITTPYSSFWADKYYFKNCIFDKKFVFQSHMFLFSNIFNSYIKCVDNLTLDIFKQFEKNSPNKFILNDKLSAYQKNYHALKNIKLMYINDRVEEFI